MLMRKVFSLLIMLAAITTACKKAEYREMRVYAVPKEIAVAQGEESFFVLKVEIPVQGHIYGNPKGPGTGKPTEVTVQGPRDVVFRPARFLKPKEFYFPGEKDFTWGYENETRIYIPLTVEKNALPGIRRAAVLFNSILCIDSIGTGGASSCMPKIFRFDVPIRILPKGMKGTIHPENIIDEYTLSSAPKKEEDTIRNETETSVSESGVTALADFSFSPRHIEPGISGIWQAILFGLIAGFLLNFMPCVLPVVSLKVMSFVQHADKNRRELFLLGIIFSLGILTSFVVLASLASFFGYKWGELFQHRLFLVVMTGIVFALALSLFGVFSINVPSFAGRAMNEKENYYADAYVKGLLATLLATPCSGPFLGGTLAWTLSQRPLVIFFVFICIGIGMALPYVVLTVNPKFLKYIPKPGEWLKAFEQIMGFLLIFTVIYFLGTFDRVFLLPMTAFLGFIAVGFWQYGRYGAIYQSVAKRIVSFMVLVIIIIFGYVISFHYLYTENISTDISAQHFSVQRMLENRDAGRISVIEFTASWCPNCRLVEKITLHTDRVTAALRDSSIDYMRADITSHNTAAEKLMLKFGSQSIPLLAVVPPGESFNRPVILRDIYSVDNVLKAIEMARSGMVKKDRFEYKIQIENSR
jgi:thiol:disulfide interchange protein DsbD